MRFTFLVSIVFTFVLNIGCGKGGGADMAFPAVKDINEYKNIEFVPTLENSVSPDKNSIYAPTLLFAWEETERQMKSKALSSDSNSQDFKLLVSSTSHKNSLTSDEYKVKVEVDGPAIFAEAYFKKLLPFENQLGIISNFLEFDKIKVKAFGMKYFDSDIAKQIRILYFKDDDHFVIELVPKESSHQIILSKGLVDYDRLMEAKAQTDEWVKTGVKEAGQSSSAWRYNLMAEDEVVIPMISFNIETKFKTLENQVFKTQDGKPHRLEFAYQRTAFLLDHRGAAVESEAMTLTDSVALEEIQRPKKLIFDKPFTIMIKRREQDNPYFMMTVRTKELLLPEGE